MLRSTITTTTVAKHALKQYNRTILVRQYANAAVAVASTEKKARRLVFDNRSPSFQDFLSKQQPVKAIDQNLTKPDNIPYLQMDSKTLGQGKKFYIEVYGCQVCIYLILTFVEIRVDLHTGIMSILDECQ